MPDILSLNQLISERVREHPNGRIIGIPDKNFNYTRYTIAEIDAAASLLANHFKDAGILPGRAKGDTTSKLTIGLLGTSNIDYVITEFALLRMGYCVLCVSPNNSPPAVAHLLTVTDASHMIVQDTLFSSATAALTHLTDPASVAIIPQPPSDLFGPDARAAHPDKTRWDPPLTPDLEHLMPAVILHSSGSTGFPKTVATTNKAAVGICKTNLGLIVLTTLPLYHAVGHWGMFRAWYSSKLLYMFPTRSLPLTSANIVKLLSQAADVQALHCVPYSLKLLAETPEGLQALRGLRVVAHAGSPCPDELGDFLVSQGVPLITIYGCTEAGQLMSSLRNFETDKGWNWLRANGPSGIRAYLRFEPRDGDTYELCVVDGWPNKVMSNRPDGSFATRDLFIQHPTIPDAYKYMGRMDDTLVMVNGEKTNPVPIELTLRSSPYVAEAVVFGSGRTQIGALILPTAAAQNVSHDELVQRIATVVDLANADAPTHSQLSTDALVLLPYGTAIPKADKESIVRAKVYKEFEKVIEEVYVRLEGGLGSEAKKHVEGETEARGIVRQVIEKTIERPVEGLKDDTDLFEFGLDSLQSTRIRNAIQREIDLGGKKLPINAVFERPSINKLAQLIVSISVGEDGDVPQRSPQEVMLELVDKYGQFSCPPRTQNSGTASDSIGSSEKVIVLTGATGSFGSYILDELLADPDVIMVYCLCRADDDAGAMARVVASIQARKLFGRFSDVHVNAKQRMVAIAADLSADRLGLEEERYRELASRATAIVHNAWPVNFNLGVSSFETHIRGAVNLMHLALSSPRADLPKFFFASSVSAVLNWTGSGSVPEAVIDDPAVAHGMGYAQSKWVTEKLCQIAASKTAIHTTVFRIGQMVGDTVNGIWNESEGISFIIKSADTIGLLPELDEQVSWLPVDYAAKSIVELVCLPTTTTKCTVYNIRHPAHIPWSSVLAALQAAQVQFKRVPRRDWLKALRASDADEQRNPSRKLLAFYEGKYGGERERIGAGLCVDKAVKESRWMRVTPRVDEALVIKLVAAWRESGFLRRA